MYEKQTWATGDVITEEKLNHMEDGIASGGGYDPMLHLTQLAKGHSVSFTLNGEAIATKFYESDEEIEDISLKVLYEVEGEISPLGIRSVALLEPATNVDEDYLLANTCNGVYFDDNVTFVVVKKGTANIQGDTSPN